MAERNEWPHILRSNPIRSIRPFVVVGRKIQQRMTGKQSFRRNGVPKPEFGNEIKLTCEFYIIYSNSRFDNLGIKIAAIVGLSEQNFQNDRILIR